MDDELVCARGSGSEGVDSAVSECVFEGPGAAGSGSANETRFLEADLAFPGERMERSGLIVFASLKVGLSV